MEQQPGGLLGYQAHAYRRGHGAFPYPGQMAQEDHTQDNGQNHQRAVKADLDSGEGEAEGLADGQNQPLTGQSYQTGVDLAADPHSHQQNAHQAEQYRFRIGGHRDGLEGPYGEIGEVAEQDGHRQLGQLDGMVIPPQEQNLKQNEDAVHGDGGNAHRQGSKQADHIGQAGDGRGAQPGFDGKGHPEGHDEQAHTEGEQPLAETGSSHTWSPASLRAERQNLSSRTRSCSTSSPVMSAEASCS